MIFISQVLYSTHCFSSRYLPWVRTSEQMYLCRWLALAARPWRSRWRVWACLSVAPSPRRTGPSIRSPPMSVWRLDCEVQSKEWAVAQEVHLFSSFIVILVAHGEAFLDEVEVVAVLPLLADGVAICVCLLRKGVGQGEHLQVRQRRQHGHLPQQRLGLFSPLNRRRDDDHLAAEAPCTQSAD